VISGRLRWWFQYWRQRPLLDYRNHRAGLRKVWGKIGRTGGFCGGRRPRRCCHGRRALFSSRAQAALRGGVGFSPLRCKFAFTRALAQRHGQSSALRVSHVAHPIIGGAIDTAFYRDTFPERYATERTGGILQIRGYCRAVWQLHASHARGGPMSGSAPLDGTLSWQWIIGTAT